MESDAEWEEWEDAREQGMTVSVNRWDEMTHGRGIDLMIGNSCEQIQQSGQ